MKIFGNVAQTQEYGSPHPDATDVWGVVVTGYDPAINKWLALEWNESKKVWLAGGGKEGLESYAHAAVRELREETGFTDFKEQIQLGGPIISHYFNDKKGVFRRSYSFAYLFLLDSRTAGATALEEHEDFTVIWLKYAVLRKAIEQTGGGINHWLAVLSRAHDYIQGE